MACCRSRSPAAAAALLLLCGLTAVSVTAESGHTQAAVSANAELRGERCASSPLRSQGGAARSLQPTTGSVTGPPGLAEHARVQAAAEQQLGVEAAAVLLPAWRAAAASNSHQLQQGQQGRSLLQNNNRNRRSSSSSSNKARNANDDDDVDEEDERGDAPAWDAGINSVQPRLSINAISNRDDEDMYKIMYLMALDHWMYKGPTSGMWSYAAIVGIHGLNQAYNGQAPKGDSGFCRHDHAQFPTWHRPYMRLYELGLQRACYKAANRFVEEDQRLAGNRTCAILRAPWWDITSAETPSLLKKKTVTVFNRAGTELIERANPLRKFCFKSTVESVTEGSKNSGDCVARSQAWAVAMRNVAANTATGLKSFYRSPWACTNTWQGNGCAGNLEGIHNGWHQAIGGDVVWLAWAAFDPLFWLFHMALDRYLYLWQVAGQGRQYPGANNYKPFPDAAHCGANLASCGVSYGSRKTGSKASSSSSSSKSKASALRSRAHLSDDQVVAQLLGSVADASGSDPGSLQAMAYLTAELSELPQDSDVYTWTAVFNRLDPYALKNRTFSLHVLLREEGTELRDWPLTRDGRIDPVELQLLPEWCSSHGSFVTWMGDMPDYVRKNRTVPVLLSPCLQRHGIATDQAPRDPSNPTLGPASLPIKKQQLQVLCVDSAGRDCTRLVRHSYSLGLGWQATIDDYQPSVQMFGPAREVTQLAAIAAVARPAAGPSPQDAMLQSLGLRRPHRALPGLGYLWSQQVEAF